MDGSTVNTVVLKGSDEKVGSAVASVVAKGVEINVDITVADIVANGTELNVGSAVTGVEKDTTGVDVFGTGRKSTNHYKTSKCPISQNFNIFDGRCLNNLQ